MMSHVGYIPTTPAMSMQYSTLELQVLNKSRFYTIQEVNQATMLLNC